MLRMPEYIFPPPSIPRLTVQGQGAVFPVHRIYCVARNYAEHAKEMGFDAHELPFFFMKPADAIAHNDAGDEVCVPYASATKNLQHEVELVLALDKGGSNIAPEDALDHIYGYAVGLDMTRRDLQMEMKKAGRPWSIAKGFDNSAPIAAICPKGLCPDIGQASIQLRVNGQLRQQSTLQHMLWSPEHIIAHISRAWHLQAGDLIFTGTPAGVAAVYPGDLLEAQVDGLPALTVRIG